MEPLTSPIKINNILYEVEEADQKRFMFNKWTFVAHS